MADIMKAIDKVISVEIGPNKVSHQLSKGDSGNYNSNGLVGTSYGYSGALAELINKQSLFESGVKNPDFKVEADKDYMLGLSYEKVVNIYVNNQGYQLQISNIPDQHIADLLMDHAIHNDVSKAITMLQVEMAINNQDNGSPVAIDGKMGPATIKALENFDSVVLYNTLIDARVFGYGNYQGNTPQERVAFQNRVLDNYPYLPMTPAQETQYANMFHVNQLQEFIGQKPDGIIGPKSLQAIDNLHQAQRWEHDEHKLSPQFIESFRSWATTGVFGKTQDLDSSKTINQPETKAVEISNRAINEHADKVESYQPSSDTSAKMVSGNTGDQTGI
jgi:lysozyme family protein